MKTLVALLLMTTAVLAGGNKYSNFRRSQNIEDRRDWSTPVLFVPQIYTVREWWLVKLTKIIMFGLLLSCSPVLAGNERMKPDNMLVLGLQRPLITDEELVKLQPNEETKKRALKRAFELNGSRMCCGFIDVSSDPYVLNAKPIKTERIFPDFDPAVKNEIDDFADRVLVPPPEPKKRVARMDVCEQHGMHKVTTNNGTSWRCRK